MGYQIECEYVNHKGRFVTERTCTVFSTEKEAEQELCDRLSLLESRGYTEVQGSVVEI